MSVINNGSSNAIFISTTTSSVSDGGLTFTLTTFNAAPNIAITLTVSGISASYQEEDIATAIYTQFLSQLLPYAYNGNPVYSDQPFVAQFDVRQSQHIVSLWSQCGYELTLISNTCGAIVRINTKPALITVDDATNFANIKGFTFTGADGNPLSNDNITDLILKSSTQLCTFLRFNVAVVTYLNMFLGKDNKSVFTKPCPGIDRDAIAVRRKAYINLYTNPTYMTFTFFWNRQTGELNYRPTSTVVNTKSPFDLDNEVHLTFRAGYYIIPEEVKWAITDLNELNLLGIYNVKALKGGSGSIEFQDVGSLYSRIFQSVKYLRS